MRDERCEQMSHFTPRRAVSHGVGGWGVGGKESEEKKEENEKHVAVCRDVMVLIETYHR